MNKFNYSFTYQYFNLSFVLTVVLPFRVFKGYITILPVPKHFIQQVPWLAL